MRPTPRAALFLSSIALYGLAFPPLGYPLLAWFCLAPMFVALHGASLRTAVLWSWPTAVLVAAAVTHFMPQAVATYYQIPLAVGIVFFVGVVSVMCWPSHLVFSVWYVVLSRRRGAVSPLLVSAAWMVSDFIRGHLQGNPWGTLAYSQSQWLPLIQIASIAGPYAVTFLIALSNAAIAEIAVRVWRGEWTWPRLAATAALPATAIAAALLFGSQQIASFAAAGEPTPAMRVVVVQGNLDLGSQWRQELYGENLAAYLKLTLGAIRDQHPALVVWPENAMTFFVQDEPQYQLSIASVLSASGVELLSGAPRKESAGADELRYFNSAFVVRPTGEIGGWYDKQYLVPFAEYFPLRRFESLNRRFGKVRQFTPASGASPLPTAAGLAAVSICNEALFPSVVADRVRPGADYIVNLANDSWLGDETYSARVLDLVRFRAVEQDRYLVRASTAGSSAVIDPRGKVLAEAAPFTQVVLGADIHARRTLTPYARFGDALVWLSMLASLIAILLPRRTAFPH